MWDASIATEMGPIVLTAFARAPSSPEEISLQSESFAPMFAGLKTHLPSVAVYA